MNTHLVSLLNSLFDCTYSATSALFNPKTVHKSESAWFKNFTTMERANKLTTDPLLKNRIRFLAVNYLNKVAPLMPSVARIMSFNFFESAFQVSPFSPYQYHRAFCRYRPDMSVVINRRFAMSNESPLVLTDTDRFDHFLPLQFIVLNRENREQWNTLLQQAMETKKPVLFDLTGYFGNTVLTEQNKQSEELFLDSYKQLKVEIRSIAGKYSQNVTVISRVKFDCNGEAIGGVKLFPVFTDLSTKDLVAKHPKFVHAFIEQTGIALGAVSLRRLVHEAYPLPSFSEQINPSATTLPFTNPEHFLTAIQTKDFVRYANIPHVAVLGRSFMAMLNGLISKIDATKWHFLNDVPATREIFQKTLENILFYFDSAIRSVENNNDFIQAIELAFAELGNLLELTRPFRREDFQSIYLHQLTKIPENLRRYLKGGLSKTAETVFAEVNVAIRKQNPNSSCASSPGFYFEHAAIIQNSPTQNKRVDLYGCAFNPSIESQANISYVKRDLIADIEEILKNKAPMDYLTVAIDFTNDYLNSDKNQELLHRFAPEIHAGRLNVVFFGSGQKFDMLGMDHFYGSPFFMINNGAAHWNAFNSLFTEEVHQTDILSTQWFCLVYEFASAAIDEFRAIFFQNVRNIYDSIPVERLAQEERNITVRPVDPKTDLTFVDVKIRGLFNKMRASMLVADYQLHATACQVKSAVRGSFGFVHPNVTLIFGPDATTLRLHPGMVRSDNEPIIKFLKNL